MKSMIGRNERPHGSPLEHQDPSFKLNHAEHFELG
jgi:hypothetical protein